MRCLRVHQGKVKGKAAYYLTTDFSSQSEILSNVFSAEGKLGGKIVSRM